MLPFFLVLSHPCLTSASPLPHPVLAALLRLAKLWPREGPQVLGLAAAEPLRAAAAPPSPHTSSQAWHGSLSQGARGPQAGIGPGFNPPTFVPTQGSSPNFGPSASTPAQGSGQQWPGVGPYAPTTAAGLMQKSQAFNLLRKLLSLAMQQLELFDVQVQT